MRAEIIKCHLEHCLLWPPGYLYSVGAEIFQNQRQCMSYPFWNFPAVSYLSHNRLHMPHLWSYPIRYLASYTYSELYAGTVFLLYVTQRNLSHFRASLQFTLLRPSFSRYILSYFPLNSDSALMFPSREASLDHTTWTLFSGGLLTLATLYSLCSFLTRQNIIYHTQSSVFSS